MDFHGRTWAEIDLSALRRNVSEIKKLAPRKELIAVVKANAYGHGDNIICPALYNFGVKFFAVSCFNEAIHIKNFIGNSEILIFGFTEIEFVKQAADNNFILTVGDIKHARQLNDLMTQNNTKLRVHIKINTGMNRVGINTKQELEEILSLSGLRCEALFTHFSAADSTAGDNMKYTREQQRKLLDFAKDRNLKIHSQNSGGILLHTDFEADYIRPGLILYGLLPDKFTSLPVDLKPVLTLKSSISQLRDLEKGDYVSYGRTYKAKEKRTAAIIPAGYADGYSRLHSNSGKIAVNGVLCPVIGRVCMDLLIIDVTDIKNVKVGDEVLLYSALYKETSVEYIAEKLGTIPYEVTCAVSHRVRRIGKT